MVAEYKAYFTIDATNYMLADRGFYACWRLSADRRYSAGVDTDVQQWSKLLQGSRPDRRVRIRIDQAGRFLYCSSPSYTNPSTFALQWINARLRGGRQCLYSRHLNFNGHSDEAIAFYNDAVGANECMVMRFHDAPSEMLPPPGWTTRLCT